MVQVIDDPYNGNIFGRLGKGIGQGLNEQLPKEIERGRLSSGLKKLQQQNIEDPFEFFTNAIGLAGMTPQIVESLGQLSKQRLQAKGLKGMAGREGKTAFPGSQTSPGEPAEEGRPSVTTRGGVEAAIQPFIPRTQEQLISDASRTFEENPGFFQFDPQGAIDYERNKDNQDLTRSQALQAQRKSQQHVQNVVTAGLEAQHKRLGGNVPAEVYSRLEDKAINAVKSLKEGGEGRTEQQASKDYGDELNRISKDYSQLRNLTRLSQFEKGSKEVNRVIKNLQKNIAERDEEEFFAKELQTNNKFSPNFAYEMAYPLSNTPALEKYFKEDLKKLGSTPLKFTEKVKAPEVIYKEISDLMNKKSGPIAIANKLDSMGYDSEGFLNYLEKNKSRLLTPEQSRQLNEARAAIPNLQDLYIKTMEKG